MSITAEAAAQSSIVDDFATAPYRNGKVETGKGEQGSKNHGVSFGFYLLPERRVMEYHKCIRKKQLQEDLWRR